MTRQEIINDLREIIVSADRSLAERASTVTEDSRIVQDLGLSSIGVLYIAIAIEEEFGIRFENVGVSDFSTVRSIVDYIESRLSK